MAFCALAGEARAQNPATAVYPDAVATDNELLCWANDFQTRLSTAIDADDTSIPVWSTTGFCAPSVVKIGSELIKISAVGSGLLTVASGGRGYDGTTAAEHYNSSLVDGFVPAAWFHQMAAEVKATQTALGANLANVSGGLDDTDDLAEGGTNLYFTNARARAAISAGANVSYDSGTGVLGVSSFPYGSLTGAPAIPSALGDLTGDTDDVPEGATNLYFTQARARGAVSGGANVTYTEGTGVFAVNAFPYGSLTGVPSTFAPASHATSHENGGGDELDLAGLAVAWGDLTSVPSTFAPTAHASAHQNGGGDELDLAGLAVAWADLTGTPAAFTPSGHLLTGSSHTASGLTTGHVLQATGATTFGFAALDYSDLANPPSIPASLTDLSDVTAKSGDTTEVATVSGTKTTGKQLAFDASGNVIATATDIGGVGGSGETNTASNVGSTGVGVFKQKTSEDLEFYKLNSTTNRLTVALDGTDKIDFTVNEGNLSIDWSQLASVPSTFPPAGHASAHESGGGDVLALGSLAGTLSNTALDAAGAAFGAGSGIDYDAGTDVLAFDPTEVGNPTWAAGGTATQTWTWDLTGTSPSIVFGDNSVTVNAATVTMAGLSVTESQISDLAHFGGAFSDLSGAATDGQIPDTITLTSIGQAGDVDLTGLADGECLVYDGTTDNRFEPGSCGSGGAEVNDLESDGAAGIASGEVFYGNGAGTGTYVSSLPASIIGSGDLAAARMQTNVGAALAAGTCAVSGGVVYESSSTVTCSTLFRLIDPNTFGVGTSSGHGFLFGSTNGGSIRRGASGDLDVGISAGRYINFKSSSGAIVASLSGSEFLIQDQTASTGDTNFTVKGGAAESGSLQRWQTSAGTTTASMTAAGALDITALSIAGVAKVLPAWQSGTPSDGNCWTYDGVTDNRWEYGACPGGAEVNDLEGDGASGIADTEIFIGTGSGTGAYAAISGDATLANTGALSLAAGSVSADELDEAGVEAGLEAVLDLADLQGDLTESRISDLAHTVDTTKTIEDEGTPLTTRATMNFTGDGVAVTDAGGKTVVTISGGAGGSGTEVMVAEYPIAAGQASNVYYYRIPADGTLEQVYCQAPTGVTFDIQLVQRASGGGTSNTFSDVQECTAAGVTLTTFADSGLLEGDRLELGVSGVAGGPADADQLYVQVIATTPGGTVADDAIGTAKLNDGASTPVAGLGVYVASGGTQFEYLDGILETELDTIAELQAQIADATLLTTADEGSGNGIDADTLDGAEGAAYLLSASLNEIAELQSQIGDATLLTTADEGTGNGIDADTVDGVEASGFLQVGDPTIIDTTSAQTLEAKLLDSPALVDDTPLSRVIPNDGDTGTTVNHTVKIQDDSGEEAVIATTSDTDGIVGVAIEGAGTTGSVKVAKLGEVQLDMDGACDLGDWVIASVTVDGEGHCQATWPTGVQVLGWATQTIGAAGLADVELFPYVKDTVDGTDDAAIHDDVSGEIAALTEKGSPVSADLLIIEDSEASNAKKKVQIGNLPGGSSQTFLGWASEDVLEINCNAMAGIDDGGDQEWGECGWAREGVSPSVGIDAPAAGHAGVTELSGTGADDNSTFLSLRTWRDNIDAGDFTNYTFAACWVVNVDSSTDVGYFAGFAQGGSAEQLHSLQLKYDTDASDTTWELESCNNGTCTTEDTGVSFATGWHELCIYASTAGSLYGSVDGTATSSAITTNLPGSGVPISPYVGVITREATGAARKLDFDRFRMRMEQAQ